MGERRQNELNESANMIATKLDFKKVSDAKDALELEFNCTTIEEFKSLLKTVQASDTNDKRGFNLYYSDKNNDGLPELKLIDEQGRVEEFDTLDFQIAKVARTVDQLWRAGRAEDAIQLLQESHRKHDWTHFQKLLSTLKDCDQDNKGLQVKQDDAGLKIIGKAGGDTLACAWFSSDNGRATAAINVRNEIFRDAATGSWEKATAAMKKLPQDERLSIARELQAHLTGVEITVQKQNGNDILVDIVDKRSGKKHLDVYDHDLAVTNSADFTSWLDLKASNIWRDLDKDNNGILEQNELDRAILNKEFTGQKAIVTALLAKAIAFFPDKQELSKSDMRTLSPELAAALSENKQSFEARLLPGRNRVLYATSDSINPEAIKQGEAPSCWFLSALAKLAQTKEGAAQIEKMIEDNHDGTYTVKFPALQEKVTVTAPTDAQLAIYGNTSEFGIWPAVLQSALGSLSAESKRMLYSPKFLEAAGGQLSNPSVPEEGIARNSCERGIWLVSPEKMTSEPKLSELSDAELHNLLVEHLSDKGTLMTAGSREKTTNGKKVEDLGIDPNHAFTVINYDSALQKIKLRNPYGKGEISKNGKPRDDKDDGIFELSLAEFRRYFDSVAANK